MLSNRGVSPVIGVILMVAITAILAAVIGGFVMDLGSQATSSSQPSVAFDYDYDGNGTLTVAHAGGQRLDGSDITIKAGDNETAAPFGSGQVTAGDSVTINVTSGETVLVIYTKGDQSTILSEHEVV